MIGDSQVQLKLRRPLRSIAILAFMLLALGALPLMATDAPPARLFPVPIILDTDIGNDVDDALALAVLHAGQARGDCELLGVTLTNPDELAGPFVNVLNTFYGRPGIPIGCTHASLHHEPRKFVSLAEVRDNGQYRYPHTLLRNGDAPEAVQLLRALLGRQPDHSVVLVQIGFFSNLAALLDTPGDTNSPLTGHELVVQKVRLLSVMAGAFQAIGNNQHYLEYNVCCDLPASQKLAKEWPTPIVWSGFEIGNTVEYPAASIEHDFGYVPHHPVAEAYSLYLPMPYNRPSWDLTAALYAVHPDRDYYDLSPPGRVTVEADGFTRFTPAEGGRDRFLILKDGQAARLREALVQLASQPPAGLGK